ncbi:hypothetical protein ABBQ32_001300 [Trebouxia sp. C0010 RCD-2024]
MAIFDRFRSRSDDSARNQSTAQPQEVLHDQPSSSRPSGEELKDVSASSSVPAAFSSDDTPKFYNPYEGLSAAVVNRSMRGGYKLPQQPEFLFSEEATVHRRGWGENLTYYTGTGYLTGALLGGSQGLVAAAKVRPEIGPDTARLRVNRVLNMTGTRGRTAGNALGVLGLLFAGIESGLGYLNDGSLPDSAATVSAGFGTGALFRSARGPRAAAVAGTVGAVAAASLVVARQTLSQNL